MNFSAPCSSSNEKLDCAIEMGDQDTHGLNRCFAMYCKDVPGCQFVTYSGGSAAWCKPVSANFTHPQWQDRPCDLDRLERAGCQDEVGCWVGRDAIDAQLCTSPLAAVRSKLNEMCPVKCDVCTESRTGSWLTAAKCAFPGDGTASATKGVDQMPRSLRPAERNQIPCARNEQAMGHTVNPWDVRTGGILQTTTLGAPFGTGSVRRRLFARPVVAAC